MVHKCTVDRIDLVSIGVFKKIHRIPVLEEGQRPQRDHAAPHRS